jgi:hypothetical protein
MGPKEVLPLAKRESYHFCKMDQEGAMTQM